MDGGVDSVDNCAGICPNCHRMLHFGKEKEKQSSILLHEITLKESG